MENELENEPESVQQHCSKKALLRTNRPRNLAAFGITAMPPFPALSSAGHVPMTYMKEPALPEG
jgi:hypothetical protein